MKGIKRNEVADILAGIGKTIKIPYRGCVDKYEFLIRIKSNILKNFGRSWKHEVKSKGTAFFPQHRFLKIHS